MNMNHLQNDSNKKNIDYENTIILPKLSIFEWKIWFFKTKQNKE